LGAGGWLRHHAKLYVRHRRTHPLAPLAAEGSVDAFFFDLVDFFAMRGGLRLLDRDLVCKACFRVFEHLLGDCDYCFTATRVVAFRVPNMSRVRARAPIPTRCNSRLVPRKKCKKTIIANKTRRVAQRSKDPPSPSTDHPDTSSNFVQSIGRLGAPNGQRRALARPPALLLLLLLSRPRQGPPPILLYRPRLLLICVLFYILYSSTRRPPP
jgi:hypothetical protein